MDRQVKRDDYLVIYVTTPTGFECKVPARGYNLKSWLAFEDNLKNTYYYEHTTKEVYEHLVFGDPTGIIDTEDDDERRTSKGKALKEAPAKRKPRAKASEDSEGVSKPRRASKPAAKRTTSTSKEARTKLREPKVSNVRKPKKDVARTNDTGKASLPRTRSSKSKTQ
jgi:hypothetical protein